MDFRLKLDASQLNNAIRKMDQIVQRGAALFRKLNQGSRTLAKYQKASVTQAKLFKRELNKAEKAQSKVNKKINKGNKNIKTSKKLMGGLAKTIDRMKFVIIATFSYQIYAGFLKGIRESVEETLLLEDSLIEIKSLLTSLGSEGDKLAEKIIGEAPQLAVDFATDLEEVTEGLYQTISAGRVGKEALDSYRKAVKLTTVAGGNQAQAIKVVNKALNAYKKQGLTAAQASETLFKVIQKGQIRMSELEKPMAKVIGMASGLGISFESAASQFATLVRQLPPREAATALANAYNQISDSAKEMEKVKKEGLVGLVKVIDKMPESVKKTVFSSKRARKAFRGLANDAELASEQIDYFETDVNALNKAFSEKLMSNSYQLSKNIQEIKKAFRDMGKVLVPVITMLSKGLKNIVNFFSKHKAIFGTVVTTLAGVVTAINPLIGVTGSLLSLIVTLASKTNKAKEEFNDFNDVMEETNRRMSALGKTYDNKVAEAFDKLSVKSTVLNKATKVQIDKIKKLKKERELLLDKSSDTYKDYSKRISSAKELVKAYRKERSAIAVTQAILKRYTDQQGKLTISVEKVKEKIEKFKGAMIELSKEGIEEANKSILESELSDEFKKISESISDLSTQADLQDLGKGIISKDDAEATKTRLEEIFKKIQDIDSEYVKAKWLDVWIEKAEELEKILGKIGGETELEKLQRKYAILNEKKKLGKNVTKELANVEEKITTILRHSAKAMGENSEAAKEYHEWLNEIKDGEEDQLTELEKLKKEYESLTARKEYGVSTNGELAKTEDKITHKLLDVARNTKQSSDAWKEYYEWLKKIEKATGDLGDSNALSQFLNKWGGAIRTATSSISKFVNSTFDMITGKIDQALEDTISTLEKQKQAEEDYANSSAATEAQRQNMLSDISEKYAKKQRKAEKKANKERAKEEKKRARFTAFMGLAEGSMNLWSNLETWNLPVILTLQGMLAGVFAKQMDTINNTKFALGGLLKGKSHAQGGIDMGNGQEAEGGEAVINKRSTKLFAPILSAINSFKGYGRSFAGVSTPKMQYGGITKDVTTNNTISDKILSVLSNVKFANLKGVTDRGIYRASVAGQPRGI